MPLDVITWRCSLLTPLQWPLVTVGRRQGEGGCEEDSAGGAAGRQTGKGREAERTAGRNDGTDGQGEGGVYGPVCCRGSND